MNGSSTLPRVPFAVGLPKTPETMKYEVLVSVCLTVFLGLTVRPCSSQAHTRPQRMAPEKAEQLRSKYAGKGFIRDMDHIKEDLKNVIQLTDDGVFTTEESIFYLMKMHDFDENNQIDGLELMRAFGHAHSHEAGTNEDGEVPIDTLEALVDGILDYDANADGYLSFAEWVKATNA